jgi:hypothetical protein
MKLEIEYVVVARRGQDGRGDGSMRRGVSAQGRVPIAPEHLFRPGRGSTVCGIRIDETWERFADSAGRLSGDACHECRGVHRAAAVTQG